MSKLDQIKALREARYERPVTRVTKVTAVTLREMGIDPEICQACGQRLPARTKAAAKQRAYRQRKAKA